MNNYILERLQQAETKRKLLEKNVLNENEKAIHAADKEYQKELFFAHDAIVDFINFQTETINILINQNSKLYSKNYVDDLLNLTRKQRAYIIGLGGNPSVLNFITINDLY